MEKNYEFRKLLSRVHSHDIRNRKAVASQNEISINENWRIVASCKATDTLKRAVKDLQDYFLVSMRLPLTIEWVENTKSYQSGYPSVLVDECEYRISEEDKKKLLSSQSFLFEVNANRVAILGKNAVGAMRGCHYLEDLLNLREAPFLTKNYKTIRNPLFSPRMIHSGWGIDKFPESYLNLISHAGYDSIVVFVKDINICASGYLDFNDVIENAK